MEIHTQQFDNGLTLVAERMPWLESAAFALLLPAGCACESPAQAGLASLTCEMVQRGAGPRDSRQFLEDLELLGAEFSSSVSSVHTSFGVAVPAENLLGTLQLYADLARRPHLDADQLDDARQSCIQEVWALEDDLAAKTMQHLRLRFYGEPFGRSSQGTEPSLEALRLTDVQRHVRTAFVPGGAILSVAGQFEWPRLVERVTELWGDWQGGLAVLQSEQPPPRGYEHLQRESSQTHIGVAFDSVPYGHPDYYDARAAVAILGDGMSSRLFTEVREKRGLCYSVAASCHSLRDRASVLCYAGATTQDAQQALDVLAAEVSRLAQGITDDELRRLKARLKSSIVMQQESSGARASAIAADWYFLHKVLTMDDLSQIVADLRSSKINAYLAEHYPRALTTVTLGEAPLQPPRAAAG